MLIIPTTLVSLLFGTTIIIMIPILHFSILSNHSKFYTGPNVGFTAIQQYTAIYNAKHKIINCHIRSYVSVIIKVIKKLAIIRCLD